MLLLGRWSERVREISTEHCNVFDENRIQSSTVAANVLKALALGPTQTNILSIGSQPSLTPKGAACNS